MVYYHDFDCDSLYLVPYMKRDFLKTRSGFISYLLLMAFACAVASIRVFQDSFLDKIFVFIILNTIFAGFVVSSWICFKVLFEDNHDQ